MSDANDPLEQRVRAHDTAALAEFLTVKRLPLLAFIERQLGTALRRKVEPEDIFQEVSMDCLRSLPDVDLTGRDPFGWLCQVAERRIIDAHRKFFSAQKRAGDREQPLDVSPERTGQVGLVNMLVVSMTSPSQAFSRNEKEFRLQAALDELPEDGRQALRLRYVLGLPSKEIAQQMGKSDGAVRVLLTRSLKKLEDLLGPDAAPRR
ncbi:MAG: sigma-70 family RNA polymerase sigma factor [Planctomycetia bacterium]|nr:sigma-70 family RNA polymerase sigma factor [Planctomycetia bacterium]